jgi:opacity protein-like surface antigen
LPAGYSPFSQIIGGVTGATNSIASVIGNIDTAFLAQGNAFVTGLPNAQPDQTSGGIWSRAIGGRVDTQATGTFSGSITPSVALGLPGGTGQVNCNSNIRQDYSGYQVGGDLARLNIGGGGASLHIGWTGGYAEANAQDTGGSNFTGNFQVPFVGMYATYIAGNFFADILARGDFYQMSLTAPDAALQNQRLDALGFTVSSSAGYRIDLGSDWYIEPSVSAIRSTVKVDTLNMPGGFGSSNNPFFLPPGSVAFSNVESMLGRAGARVGTGFTAGNVAWQSFATVSIWHEFAGNSTATYTAPPYALNGDGNAVSGTLSNSRVGTYGQYSVGISGQVIDTPWLGYFRIDYKEGPNIEALGFNAGLRYQFDPTARAAAAPAGGLFKAPPRVAPAYDWTGLYIGGFAGSTWGVTHWNFPGVGSANPAIAGALGGATLGYNKQIDRWVLGVEGDVGGTNANGGTSCVDGINNIGFLPAANCNNDVRVLATATARVGYTWLDRVLVFAKAGGAWTSNSLSASCNGDATFIASPPANGCLSTNTATAAQNLTATDSRFGWTAGVGFEIGLTPNWSAKVEYDYLDFGSKNLTLPDTTPVNIKESFNEFKVGLNYRFGASGPEAASPVFANKLVKAPSAAPFNWTGVYAGVEVADQLSFANWNTTALPGCPICTVDPTTTPASFFSSSLQGGVYLGYNWQFAPRWVAGIEGDVADGASSSMTRAGIPGTFGNGADTGVGIEAEGSDSATVRFGWDSTFRGRLGFLAAPGILVYGTGGVAFQQVSVGAACDGSANSWCFFGPKSQTFSAVRTGWTAGGGLEGVLAGNWLGKLEFRYADFGNYNNVFFAGTGDDVATSVHLHTYTFLAGIGYKFN